MQMKDLGKLEYVIRKLKEKKDGTEETIDDYFLEIIIKNLEDIKKNNKNRHLFSNFFHLISNIHKGENHE